MRISILLLIFITCLSLCFTATGQLKYYDITRSCLIDERLFEELLIPTRQDSAEYEILKFRYPHLPFKERFNYMYLPFIRGLVDTTILNAKHYNRFKHLSDAVKTELLQSPLIFEGTVQKIYYPDTALGATSTMYQTSIVIKIDDVIFSKYDIEKGSEILSKINLMVL